MKRFTVAVLALLVLIGASLGAQRMPFRTMPATGGSPGTGTIVWDCGIAGAAYPTCGADSVDADGVLWDRSYRGTVGPQGQNTVRIDHVGTTDTGAEYYHGKWDWTGPTVAQGACIVFREIITFVSPIDWNDDAGGRFGFKHAVIGADGATDTNRGFINLRSNLTTPADAHDGAHVMFRIEKNIDGPPSRVDIRDLVAGVPYFLQVEFCSSSTAVATDGSIKAYLNNNTYASPTAQSSGGFAWPTTGWERIALGFYGESLGVGHHAAYDIAAFTYTVGTTPGSAFNSSFYVP